MNSMLRKERILVIQPYGIGDTLFMLPLLKALRLEKKPEYIDCILGPRTSHLLQNLSYIDDVFVVDKDKWRHQSKISTLFDKIKLLSVLKNKRYTMLLDFSMQPEYSFWGMFYLAIPLRAGFNYRDRNSFLTHPLLLPDEGFSKKHVIEYFCDLGRMLGVEVAEKRPDVTLTSEQLSRAKKILGITGGTDKKYIIVSPGGGVTWGQDAGYKHWPVEYFAKLIILISNKIDFEEVVVLGSGNEAYLGEGLKNALQIKVVNLAGKTDLIEATSIIKGSLLFLGNDGGLAHLAVSQDTAVIAFYGPADPNVYGVYPDSPNKAKLSKNLNCQPCYKNFRYNKNCSSLSCLKGFTPEEAFDRLAAMDFFRNYSR